MEQEEILYMNRKDLEAYLKSGLKENVMLIIEDGSIENGKEDSNGRNETECGTYQAD